MRARIRPIRCLFFLPCLAAVTLPLGCGGGSVPAGGQANVEIPAEQAAKQNDAYKNYSKTKPGRPPG